MRQHLKNAFIPNHGNNHIPRVLRRKPLAIYSLILIAVKIMVILAVLIAPTPARLAAGVDASQLISLTNQERTSRGLNSLNTNPALTAAAKAKAQYMLDHDVFEHGDPWTFIRDAGYDYLYAGENIAMDFQTTAEVHQAWMASSSHRANILKTQYQDIGIAAVAGRFKDHDTIMVVQMFGSPKTPPPTTPPTPTPTATPTPTLTVTPAVTATPNVTSPTPTPTPIPTPDRTPPAAPSITFPTPNSFVSEASVIKGTAESGSVVTLYDNNIPLLETFSRDGTFTGQLSGNLGDGKHTLTAVARDSAGNASRTAAPITFTVDTTAPVIDASQTTALIDLTNNQIDVRAAVTDPTLAKVSAGVGDKITELNLIDGKYSGVLTNVTVDSNDPAVYVEALDQAGHKQRQLITNYNFGGVSEGNQPTGGPLGATFLGGVADWGQYLIFAFIIFLIVALMIKIFVRIRIQHPPTIVHTLVVLLLASVLLII